MERSFPFFICGPGQRLVRHSFAGGGMLFRQGFRQRDRLATSLALLNPVTSFLPNNGKQPVSCIGFMRSCEFPPRLQVSFLNNGLRGQTIFSQPACEIIRTIEVRQEKFFEMRLGFPYTGKRASGFGSGGMLLRYWQVPHKSEDSPPFFAIASANPHVRKVRTQKLMKL